MALIVTGRVTGQGPTGDSDQTLTNIVIAWQTSGVYLSGKRQQGVDAFPVDLSLSEAAIVSSLKAQLAAHVATVTGAAIAEADVRGCTL